MSKILRYDLNWESLGPITSFELITSMFLIYIFNSIEIQSRHDLIGSNNKSSMINLK